MPRHAVAKDAGAATLTQRGGKRRLASGGIILAFLLELCGCNPTSPEIVEDQLRVGEAGVVVVSAATQQAVAASRDLIFYDPSGPALDRHADAVSSSLFTALANIKPPLSAIPESVFFVYKSVPGDDGLSHLVPNATAFVLSVPIFDLPDRSHKRFVRFLVTARHVVDPEWAHCSEHNPDSIAIRLNKWTGGVGYENIALRNDHASRFFTPSDNTLDLAVIPFDPSLNPRLDSYKFIDVPFRLVPTASQLRTVHVDQQIITAALLTRHAGGEGNYPVSQSGSIADMPADPIEIRCVPAYGPTPVHLWFIHATVPQGLSGAPVYAAMSGSDQARTPILLGVQSVAWKDKGVAGITPAAVLGDVIQSALRQQKMEMDLQRLPSP